MWDNFKQTFNKEFRTKHFIKVLTGFFVASALIFWLLILGQSALNNKKSVEETRVDPFANIDLQAKSVFVFDVSDNHEIFSKNPDESLPLASLTKVMTAVTAWNELTDDQKIKITKEYLTPEGDSKFLVGDIWQAKDLIDFTLLTSSNDGASALAAVVASGINVSFIDKMNQTASKIGLSNSKFFNEHGLDQASSSLIVGEVKAGAYGSARDMATLFSYTLKNYPGILEVTRYKNLDFKSVEKKYNAENTNPYVNQIPNVIASKTGFTDLAGGNLVIAFDAGLEQPIIISILGSTTEGRFEDALKLASATMEYIKQAP